MSMENTELGQRRWEALLTRRFWQKISQIVCAIVAIVLCTIFDQTARVHMINTQQYYNISLKFPFIYESNVTVQSPPDLQLRKLKFEALLFPSAITFVIVTALALLLAIIILLIYISRYGLREEHKYIKLEFFISLGVTFLLFAGVCLWLANLVALVHDVNHEIDSLLGLCQDNNRKCETKKPNFITLHISTTFAIILFLLWLIECIQVFIKMVFTIPRQITLTTLVPNVELDTLEKYRVENY